MASQNSLSVNSANIAANKGVPFKQTPINPSANFNFSLFPMKEKEQKVSFVENYTNYLLDNGKYVDYTDDLQDGLIGTFQQGKIGNCWLLSSLKVLSETPQGKSAIQNAIKQNENGDYIVSFKGAPNKVYVVKEKDMQRANDYSKGDKDVKILELAIEKWHWQTNKKSLWGGKFQNIKKLILNEDAHSVNFKTKGRATVFTGKFSYSKDKEKFFKDIPNGFSFYMNIHPEQYSKFVDGPRGEKFYSNHAYCAKRIGNYVKIHNPHDTGKKPQILTIEEFSQIKDLRIFY